MTVDNHSPTTFVGQLYIEFLPESFQACDLVYNLCQSELAKPVFCCLNSSGNLCSFQERANWRAL